MTYIRWKLAPAYWRDTAYEATMEEIILDFFHCGLSNWIKECGYKWSIPEADVARKFLRFCYVLDKVVKSGDKTTIQFNYVNHRNLPEDLETYEHFTDTPSFSDMVEVWSFYPDILETPHTYLIHDFCYAWIDVESGAPGRWTEDTLNMDTDNYSDDERTYNGLPDAKWYKSRNDLY